MLTGYGFTKKRDPLNGLTRCEKITVNKNSKLIFWIGTFSLASYISIFSGELSKVTHPFSSNADGLHIYWVVTIICILCLSVFVWTSTSAEQQLQNNLVESQLSSPPAMVLNELSDDYQMCYDHFLEMAQYEDDNTYAVIESIEQYCTANNITTVGEFYPLEIDEFCESFEKLARIIMLKLITIAKKWDHANTVRNGFVTYRANVMHVIHFDDADLEMQYATKIQSSNGSLKFCTSPADSHYHGIVSLLSNMLAVSSKNADADEDINLFSIPFTYHEGHVKGSKIVSPFHNNIEGAPSCVTSGCVQFVQRTKSIIETYIAGSVVIDETKSDIKKYYEDQQDISQSILSIPIYEPFLRTKQRLEELGVPEPAEKDLYPFVQKYRRVAYVLNIYRNQEGMLYNGNKADDFADITRQFAILLGEVLDYIPIHRLVNHEASKSKKNCC